MTFNIAVQQEQEQRVANDLVAYEYKIQRDSFDAIRAEAKEHGRQGAFPEDPNSPIYWMAYCDGLQEYAIAQIKADMDWGSIPF